MKDEAYWHAKHPVKNIVYRGRPLPGGGSYEMDVRNFLWPQDCVLQKIVAQAGLLNATIDATAWACQKFVVDNIKYVADKKALKADEYWLFAPETWVRRRGDCEDGAILIASLLLNTLPPQAYWRVRLVAGWVQDKPDTRSYGHCYVAYCRTTDNEWVTLDWCFYQDSNVLVHNKPLLKNRGQYGDAWFSTTCDFAYSHEAIRLTGRVQNHETNPCVDNSDEWDLDEWLRK